MVKLNTLQETLKKYPHFFNKEDYSYFTRHQQVINNQQQDIRHKLKTVEWGRLLEKPLQIWKTQTEPYKYDINVQVKVPSLRTVKVYRNPQLKDNKVLSYDEIIIDKEWEDEDNTIFYEDSVSLEVEPYETITHEETIFDEETIENNGLESYIIVQELPTPDKEEIDNIYFKDIGNAHYNAYTIQKITLDGMASLGLTTDDVYIDNVETEETLYNSLLPSNNNLEKELNDKYTVSFTTCANWEGMISFDTLYFAYDGNSWVIEGNIDKEWTDISNSEEHLWEITISKHDMYSIFTVKCDDNVLAEEQLEHSQIPHMLIQVNVVEGGISNFIYGTNHDEYYGYVPIYENIPYTVQTTTEEYQHIIPKDNFLLEITTHDDYRFLKGYPQNDYTVKEDNILQYQYNTTFLDISQETISYTKYLTFRVHKDKIKKITILRNEKPLLEQEFILNLIGETKSTDFSYYYYGDEHTGYYEVENTEANNEQLYFADTEKDEYVYRHRLSDMDFNEDGTLKDSYDLIVTTYENRYHCRHDYEKVYSKRYNGYDGELNDCFDHDYSLDIIGNMLNVPRKRFYQVYNDDEEYLSRTYPPYFDRATEDDYDYMKRIQRYIEQYNQTPFPVLEFWKHYQIYPELQSRKKIIGEMDESIFRADDDIICDSDYISTLTEDDADETVKGYFPSNATSIQGSSNIINRDGTVWHEAVIAKDVYIVPDAEYRFRYSIQKADEEPVTIRLISYGKDGNSLRSMSIPYIETEEDTTLYNTTEGYIPYDSKIIIPNNAVTVKLLLESNTGFDYADASFERIKVIDYSNPYQTTDTEYNSNFYELYADYEDIPSNIRIGGGERFKWQLRRSLPLTKQGLLYMNIKKPLADSININTGYEVFIDNLIPPSDRTGEASDGHPYSTTINSKLLLPGIDYQLDIQFTMEDNTTISELYDYSQEYEEPTPLTSEYLLVELIYNDGTENHIRRLDDHIYSDALTHIKYGFKTPDDMEWETMTIRIQSEIPTIIHKVKLSTNEPLTEETLTL